ncbi:MAG: hypothetical protein FWC38_08385 [Proteobacteria bacterium]|nr:hypothetical protein [Pseudomonadota bacterium]MCL2308217.1 hypothetical protein [Pseudomonadota bacterium]
MAIHTFRAGRPTLKEVPLTVVERVERYREKKVRYDLCVDRDLHQAIEEYRRQGIPANGSRTKTVERLLRKALLLPENKIETQRGE